MDKIYPFLITFFIIFLIFILLVYRSYKLSKIKKNVHYNEKYINFQLHYRNRSRK